MAHCYNTVSLTQVAEKGSAPFYEADRHAHTCELADASHFLQEDALRGLKHFCKQLHRTRLRLSFHAWDMCCTADFTDPMEVALYS
ncbi:MAG: hypothetical protein NVS2B12_30690 [Ktedonobacteraceae bacterium]